MAINIKDFASRVEGMANILGAYVESSLKDKGQIDQQVKTIIKGLEDYIAQAVADRLQDQVATPAVTVKIKTLPHFSGDLPQYQSDEAAGFDVCAQINKNLTLEPGQRELVPTGLSFEIPPGYEIQVRPRSGLAIKQGISLVNTPGTIDSDYRGEVKVILINLGQEHVEIEPGQRIAQMIVAPVVQAELELVEDLNQTARGEGGFGSTGVVDSPEEEVEEEQASSNGSEVDTESSEGDSVIH